MGRIVNQAELVEILGRDNSTIWEWQKETPPLPILERGARGEENKYDTAAVIAWQLNRAEQRAGGAKSRLETELLEMEVREKRAKEGIREKTLVPVDQVRPVWESRVMTAAAFMQSRHSRLAAILEAAPGLEAKRELLKREDAGFLRKLGVEGDRMQAELEKLLATISPGEVEVFWQRLHGDGSEQRI
jgi:phage terminase Nu1 subunit (DNA packaging protein)